MINKLEQLRTMTDVVADTGDIEAIRRYRPVDATTNPSLLLKAAQMPQYQHLLEAALHSSDRDSAAACDHLAVAVGKEILNIIPGRVSTEVDARLSFDTRATMARAQRLIDYYEAEGIARERVLIKIAATWEGIRAAEQLEKSGINCNMTLLFNFAQAAAAADAGVTLISPFVGRIYDWYKQRNNVEYTAENDPGVASVRHIYNYYKHHGYHTIVMGASFRNIGQIEGLAGCDRLTISPQLLEELAADTGTMQRKLDPEKATSQHHEPIRYNEADFRYAINADAMATEKLAEGIRTFVDDQVKLEKLLASKLG